MDSLETEVKSLVGQVATLYEIVAQINTKMSLMLAEQELISSARIEQTKLEIKDNQIYGRNRVIFEPSEEHKDVLVESKLSVNASVQYLENELTPDIQIQRLTAQLTAAYNRIAALEERLLAAKIHY
ncbi:MAG TPA: hypothetical protein IGS52_02260 [Oscillatoriaceae cyanobacterium M33_DOE_052]|uniref:Uncharacterized protein n=1 Tax=Planktothricoides sp. SpSt-374 TaxID=2282167 RepID=A0A7C3VIA2_9CYAN|nr:hypothetical protein [Oscillatoriaceae cyanobacterium M33_DOE_052]